VRNKTTGSRGVAALEYHPASGRYYELGQGPTAAAAAAASGGAAVPGAAGAAAAGGPAAVGAGGERWSKAREGEGLVEVEAAEGEREEEVALGGVSEDLRRQRHDQEELQRYKQRAGEYDGANTGRQGVVSGGGPLILQRDDEEWPTAASEDA
jgi:hypothetical protein